MYKLRIHSYNCKNLKSSLNEIQEICDQSDILLLQETWLRNSELHLLNQIHPQFCGLGISAMNTESELHLGRPHGGVAIIWRKHLSEYIFPVNYNDTRLQGIELALDKIKILVINIYMPCSTQENLELFTQYLTKIDSVITASDTPYCMIMGDFNANLKLSENGEISQLFGKKLMEYCDREQLCISDYTRNTSLNPYTFISASQGSTSWLDHCICTYSMNDLITEVGIIYKYVTSDHLPIQLVLDVDLCTTQSCDSTDQCVQTRVIKWNTLTNSELESYKHASKQLLTDITLNHKLLQCHDPHCMDNDHILAIDELYNGIVNALHVSSEPLQKERSCSDKVQQVPGWNDYCKELHSLARDAFLTWRSNGSPRYGPIYEAMSKSRAQFKRVLRQCKSDKNRLMCDSLAKKLLLKDTKQFWNEVNSSIGKKMKLSTITINGVTGSKNICSLWKDHFSGLLNSSTSSKHKESVMQTLDEISKSSTRHVLFNTGDIDMCLKKLKKGKSAGIDRISSEHLLHASPIVCFYLSCLFNGMLIHGYLPEQLMKSTIITLVKDKKGLLCDKDNYRPIAITTAISKLLELVILEKFSEYLSSTTHQFGFKKHQSTDMCIFAMKEVIEYYNKLSSPVFLCFIDASKAFDKINHWCLYKKLLDRNMPRVIVRLLMIWYSSQSFNVKWEGCISESFHVSNGVRQGGILSPHLFSVYMDELSTQLMESNIGCHFNNVNVNHLFYADDAVLLAPTAGSLQTLINICYAYSVEHEITYNTKKSVCMTVVPNLYKELHIPTLFLGCKALKTVNEHKYLGVIIQCSGMDDLDISRQIRATYIQGNCIIHKFRGCSDYVKVQLFKTYCYNMYGSQLWAKYSTGVLDKLRVAFNNVFRIFMSIDRRASISAAFIQKHVHHFNVLQRKIVFGFRKRLLYSGNSIVKAIVHSPYFIYGSALNSQWRRLLF